MEPQRRIRLVQIMTALAVGDHAMVFALIEEFEVELTRQVRHIARAAGRQLSPEQVADLVVDCGLVLAEVAAAWRPDGGALPWTWARARLAQVVHRELFGPEPVDPADLGNIDGPEGSGPVRPAAVEPDWCGILSGLAAGRRDVAGVVVELEQVSERNRQVFLEFRLQQDLGDPSPANTVADMFDLQPANVRQIVQRTRRRLEAAGLAVA